MTGVVIVLLVVVGFFWMFNRSVKAGYGKFLFWLLWMIGGICSLLALPLSARPVAQVLVWLWMAGVLGLPVYWLLRAEAPPRSSTTTSRVCRIETYPRRERKAGLPMRFLVWCGCVTVCLSGLDLTVLFSL